MTTIAFADSRGQLAAATSNESSPQPKEPDKSLGNIPNPKIFSDQHSILRKIQEVANMIKKEQYKQQEHAENRFGQS